MYIEYDVPKSSFEIDGKTIVIEGTRGKIKIDSKTSPDQLNDLLTRYTKHKVSAGQFHTAGTGKSKRLVNVSPEVNRAKPATQQAKQKKKIQGF